MASLVFEYKSRKGKFHHYFKEVILNQIVGIDVVGFIRDKNKKWTRSNGAICCEWSSKCNALK